MPELKNKVAIECSRPLTERGWIQSKHVLRSGYTEGRFTKHEADAPVRKSIAEARQALKDKPLLIAELKRLEAENERIREELKSK